MKRLGGKAHIVKVNTSAGAPCGLGVELTNDGDEAVSLRAVHLSRKGINLYPEFGKGFNLDPNDIIEGLPPEQYQVRVEMPIIQNGNAIPSGNWTLALNPKEQLRAILPIAPQTIQFFQTSPPEDLFIAVEGSGTEEVVVVIPDLFETIGKCIANTKALGRIVRCDANITLKLPARKPPDPSLSVSLNDKPINPMPPNN